MKSHSAESIAGTHPSSPDGWRVDSFERLAVLQRGFDLPSSARTKGDVPIIGSNGIVGWHSEARVHGPGVVTGRSGSIGESTYVEGYYWPLNTSLYVSHFHDNIPRFVHYFIQWFDLSRFASGVSVPTLNRNSVYGTEVKIPSPAEQEKIAAVLWKLQRAIATQDRLIATTRDLKQSAMNRLFTHGLCGEVLKETEIGPMPESWRIADIDEMATVSSGGTPSRTNPEYWSGGSIPWVKTGEVDYRVIEDTEEKITPEGMKNSAAKLLPKGTLLLAMYGQGVTRGKVAILGIEATTNQACAALQLKNKKIDVNFLYYVLVAGYERLRSLAHGGQQQNLNGDLIRGFSFATSDDLDEQRDIAAALTTIDCKLAHHQKKRAALNDLFQTLLHKLMTGEIRVADIDIDTSEITAPSKESV